MARQIGGGLGLVLGVVTGWVENHGQILENLADIVESFTHADFHLEKGGFKVLGFFRPWKKTYQTWWVSQIAFGIFTPKIGEDEPNLTNFFQMGWNHQL